MTSESVKLKKLVVTQEEFERQNKKVAEIEQQLKKLGSGVLNDMNVVANQLEKVDALSDRHSTKIRGLENTLQQFRQTFGQIMQEISELRRSIIALEPSTEDKPEDEIPQ